MSAKETCIALLRGAGIEVNGPNPWDMQVHNDALYGRILSDPELQLGETYMDQLWSCERIDIMIDKILRSRIQQTLSLSFKERMLILGEILFNPQIGASAAKNVAVHYDIGNELYTRMLDPYMQYTCGYWRNGAKDLSEAQEHKLELICRKLGLRPGMKMLDLGCGWGGLMRYAAEKYQVESVGYTLSKEQVSWIQETCAGLPIRVIEDNYLNAHNRLQETGQFDVIAVIGAIEHCGAKNYRAFMETCSKCLKTDGIFMVHTIISSRTTNRPSPFLYKYIFPGSKVPSPAEVCNSAEDFFVLEDVHNFGEDYDYTLMAWNDRFQASWPELSAMAPDKYNERFKRMWEYYLAICAGSFRARGNQLMQFMFTKDGRKQPNCRFS